MTPAELTLLQDFITRCGQDSAIAASIGKLLSENARLRETLAWYADKRAYDQKIFANVGGIDVIACDLIHDAGARARAALEATE